MNIDALFDTFPVLSTERLLLRQPRLRDADDVFAYASSAEVSRWTTWPPHSSPAVSADVIQIFNATYQSLAGVVWLIELKATQRVVGSIGLTLKPRDRYAELGYALGRAHWGYGYMPEAIKAVLELAFAQVGLVRVQARCLPANQASARVLEKTGFVYEGLLRQSMVIKGQPQDLRMYAILRQDWQQTS